MTTLIKQERLTISQMKAAGEGIGYTWFSKANMNFFNTIIETVPNMANLFITSEKIEDWHKRRYTLRWYNHETSHIETVSEFMEFETIEGARKLRKMYTDIYKTGVNPLDAKAVLYA
jgi:hypothetical protein